MDDKMVEAWMLIDARGLSKLFDSREAAERWRSESGATARVFAVVEWERLRRLEPPVAPLPGAEQPPLNEYGIGELVLVRLPDKDVESYGRVRDYWLSVEGWVVMVSVFDEDGNITGDVEISDRKKLWRYR